VGAGWFLSQNKQQNKIADVVENKLERAKPTASLRIEKNNSGKDKQMTASGWYGNFALGSIRNKL
jgi:hypothetical protein